MLRSPPILAGKRNRTHGFHRFLNSDIEFRPIYSQLSPPGPKPTHFAPILRPTHYPERRGVNFH